MTTRPQGQEQGQERRGAGGPGWAECRAAAASIREAEYAREADAMLRPRGVLGVLRSRGPLPLVLYAAARDGLLVWRGPDSLAVLQTPGDRARRAGAPGLRAAAIRFVARNWDLTVFLVPTVLLLLLTTGAAALVAAGVRAFVPVALLLILVMLLHVTFLLGCLVVNGLLWFFREFGRPPPGDDTLAEQLLPGRQWSVVLCHHAARGPARQLLRQAEQRLERLLTGDVDEVADETGVRIRHAAVTEELIWLLRGTTTQDTRDAVKGWSLRPGSATTFRVRASAYRARRLPTRLFDHGGFLFWYVAGEAIVIAVLARLVPGWEREVCAPECAGNPAQVDAALRWLLQRLLLTDPYGITPASREAWTLGWLVSLMSLMGVAVAGTAVRQYTRARRAVHAAAERRRLVRDAETRTLIMVVTRAERDAVRAAVKAVTGSDAGTFTHGNQVIFDFGTVGATRLWLVQVAPGTVNPGAAAITAAALVGGLELDFILLAGICYGLEPGKQQYGDVLVCTQLRAVEHRKEAEPPDAPPIPEPADAAQAAALLAEPPPAGDRTVIMRGDAVTPSVALINRLQAFEAEWDQPAVHFGPMLSASTLVSARSLRDELAAQHPDAIGGEMEGAGVYAAAAHAKVDWIVVKAVCDWGFGKGDTHHEQAATNAARFVVGAAAAGWFDEATRRGEL